MVSEVMAGRPFVRGICCQFFCSAQFEINAELLFEHVAARCSEAAGKNVKAGVPSRVLAVYGRSDSAVAGSGGWFCVDWNDAGENVERSGCVRAFSPRRAEKRGVLRVWGSDRGSARIGTMWGRTLKLAFRLFLRFSPRREEKRGVLRVWGAAEVMLGLERCEEER